MIANEITIALEVERRKKILLKLRGSDDSFDSQLEAFLFTDRCTLLALQEAKAELNLNGRKWSDEEIQERTKYYQNLLRK